MGVAQVHLQFHAALAAAMIGAPESTSSMLVAPRILWHLKRMKLEQCPESVLHTLRAENIWI